MLRMWLDMKKIFNESWTISWSQKIGDQITSCSTMCVTQDGLKNALEQLKSNDKVEQDSIRILHKY